MECVSQMPTVNTLQAAMDANKSGFCKHTRHDEREHNIDVFIQICSVCLSNKHTRNTKKVCAKSTHVAAMYAGTSETTFQQTDGNRRAALSKIIGHILQSIASCVAGFPHRPLTLIINHLGLSTLLAMHRVTLT